MYKITNTNIYYNTQDHVSILIKLKINKQTVNVILECISYPFKSPIITVNSVKNELLQIRNMFFTKMFFNCNTFLKIKKSINNILIKW